MISTNGRAGIKYEQIKRYHPMRELELIMSHLKDIDQSQDLYTEHPKLY